MMSVNLNDIAILNINGAATGLLIIAVLLTELAKVNLLQKDNLIAGRGVL